MGDSDTETRTEQGPEADGAGSAEQRSAVSDRRLALVALAGVALVVVGAAAAALATTAGGIAVSETSFETDSGIELRATVYAPPDASADDPAPAAVLIHGYSGERGTMNSFAIELARRGYVAVAVDAPGHGESGGAVGDDGIGGPAALEGVRSMAIVDGDRVAVGGHSMGGSASLEAARAHPDGYASVVLVSSSWDDDDDWVDETTPRNMAVVFGRYDELAAGAWGQPAPGGARHSEKLAAAFGTEPPVERGRVYGDVEAGTGRTLTAPPTIHIGMHRSTAAVGDTVEWIALTTDGPAGTAPGQQRWYWAFLGHILAMAGGLVVAVAVTALAWRRLGGPRAPADVGADLPRRTALALTAIPPVLVYPAAIAGFAAIPTTPITPQAPTNGYVVWALGSALVAAGVVRWRHGGVDRASLRRLVPGRETARRAIAGAVAGAAALYVLAAVLDAVPGAALRGWLVVLGTPTPVRWLVIAVYALPFVAAALALSVGLGRVVGPAATLRRDLARQLGVAAGGLVVFLALQYVPLFLGVGLPVPVSILSSVAIFATGYVAVATAVSTACYWLTGSVWPGGLLAGLLVTWGIAGGGPIHVAPL